MLTRSSDTQNQRNGTDYNFVLISRFNTSNPCYVMPQRKKALRARSSDAMRRNNDLHLVCIRPEVTTSRCTLSEALQHGEHSNNSRHTSSTMHHALSTLTFKGKADRKLINPMFLRFHVQRKTLIRIRG